MKQEVEKKHVALDKEISENILKIIAENLDQATPYMKLFWDQQQKFFSSKNKSLCYHPVIIRFSLSLAAMPALAYDELRNSKCLILPSMTTLRKYKNMISPKAGFDKKVIDQLIKKARHLKENQRCMSFIMNKIKAQQNLVYDKYTHQLIGYVDLGDPQLNFSTFNDCASKLYISFLS